MIGLQRIVGNTRTLNRWPIIEVELAIERSGLGANRLVAHRGDQRAYRIPAA